MYISCKTQLSFRIVPSRMSSTDSSLDDTAAQLVHAVLTNTQMWDQDLTKIEGLEAAVLADLELIRSQGAEAAYKSCL